jgi:hypothetical protein
MGCRKQRGGTIVLTSIARGAAEKSHAAEFDLLSSPRNPRISIRSATVDDIEAIYRIIYHNVSFAVAPPPVMRFAMAINRNNIVTFLRHGEVVGVYAMLMLSTPGLEALLTGEFNGRDPHVAHLATRLEQPAAIYQWLVVAPGLAAEGVLHVSRLLRHPYYRNANLYARLLSADGARITSALGFKPVGGRDLGLTRYVRLVNRVAPSAADAEDIISRAA